MGLSLKINTFAVVKNEQFKNIIASVFLALFISTKLIGLHALTHSDDGNHPDYCLVCEHMITNNLTPILPVSEQNITFNYPFTPIEIKVIVEYHFVYGDSDIPNHLFSRPPPII